MVSLIHSIAMGKYEVVGKRTVWEGEFLRSFKVTYRDRNGSERQWEAVERVGCEGVIAIVPVTDEGEVILIRQFRPPVDNYVIELPAGLIDTGESPEKAARRELMEETGYEPREMIFLARGPLSSGTSKEILTVFLAKGLRFRGIGKRDETEDIEVMKVPLDDMYEKLSRLSEEGDLVDLKILGLVEIAKRRL